jgi:uncharacterized membrane protein SpoIIM required for sporulation
VRAQRATPDLIAFLNEIVGDAHGVLYAKETGSDIWHRFVRFFVAGYPAVLRRRMAFVGAAFAFMVIGAVFAYWLVRTHPSTLSVFIPPQFQDSVKGWKEGFADNGTISAGEGAIFSTGLMTHNTEVGIVAFALGVTVVIPAYLMLDNGFIMGALIAAVQPTGHLPSLWPGILPHGAFELTAIFICAGAGLLLGWSFVDPGRQTRSQALVSNAGDAVRMVIGTVPMFILAGIIEGNISHAHISHAVKYAMAAFEFAALVFYVYRPRFAPRAKK